MDWIQRMAVIILFICNVFCKWIRLQNILYFCIFNYARGDKQKVWSKAENREQDWRETLRTVSFLFLSPHTPYRCVRLAHFARVRCLSYAKRILRRKLTLRWPCIMQLKLLVQSYSLSLHQFTFGKVLKFIPLQRAKKVVSDSPGRVDFAIGLVNSVFNLLDGQVMFFEEFDKQKNCEINSASQKFLGLGEMTSGLVNASFSLPEWQAVKMIFFAPWPLGKLFFLFSPITFYVIVFFAAYWFILYWQVKQYKCGMLNIFFKYFNGI